jgi:methylmalonyl-CoA/ethylmalonyl-CoA epimerase
MFRTTDLKVVTVATDDLDAAVSTFQRNFAFPLTRSAESTAHGTASRFLAIGEAEIEMTAAAKTDSTLADFLAERGPGLHTLLLEVDDLPAAVADLTAKGFVAKLQPGTDGHEVAILDPAQTHGARIALAGRAKT